MREEKQKTFASKPDFYDARSNEKPYYFFSVPMIHFLLAFCYDAQVI